MKLVDVLEEIKTLEYEIMCNEENKRKLTRRRGLMSEKEYLFEKLQIEDEKDATNEKLLEYLKIRDTMVELKLSDVCIMHPEEYEV